MSKVNDILDTISSMDNTDIDLREFAFHLMTAFGGPKELASKVAETYNDAPEGSMNRVSILKNAVSIIDKVTSGGGGAADPSDMTDEELLKELGLIGINNEPAAAATTAPEAETEGRGE